MDRRALWAGAGVVAVVALAAWFRFYDIQNYPPGLFPDQAANGEDALLILEGDVRPFYPRGNGREALFFYIEAATIKLFGIGVWPMFAASALVGTLTVAALYAATRVWFGRLSGLLAAYFLATSYWHVTLSRTGFRAILIPLFVALFTAFAGATVRAVKRDKDWLAYVYAALAGAALAGGFYTYIAYRVMVGVVLGIAVLVLLDDFFVERSPRNLPHVQRYWKQLVVATVAGMLVLAPLGWFFIQEPAAFVGRAGQVSIFSPDLQAEYGGGTLVGTLLYSTRETLLAFFAGAGDTNWRHSVAGFPLLNPLVGLLFLAGLVWAIHGTVVTAYKIIKVEEVHLGMIYPYLLLLLAGMLVPVVTTAEGMPHGLRSIGLVLPIFLLAGTAGSVTVYWIRRRLVPAMLRPAALGIAAGLVALSGIYDGVLYFGFSRNDARAHYAYRADLTEVSEFILEQSQEGVRPYLVLDRFSVQTVHFLTSVVAHEYTQGDTPHPDAEQHRYQQVEPERAERTQLEPGEMIIFTQSTLPDAERYQAAHPGAELLEERRNRFGEIIMQVYHLPAAGGGGDDGGRVEGSLDA